MWLGCDRYCRAQARVGTVVEVGKRVSPPTGRHDSERLVRSQRKYDFETTAPLAQCRAHLGVHDDLPAARRARRVSNSFIVAIAVDFCLYIFYFFFQLNYFICLLYFFSWSCKCTSFMYYIKKNIFKNLYFI